MKIQVPYGQDTVPLEIEDSRVAGLVYPNDVPHRDAGELIAGALENPYGGETFSDFISGDGKTLVIVNDGTRPTPTAKVLDALPVLVNKADCSFIIATGVHRAPTEEEFRFIFGEHYDSLRTEGKIFVHDAKNDTEMVYIGESGNGTPMRVNRRAMEADRIVIIGSVEPHYFAGYTGGRKSFLPGLAAYDTITVNHKYALNPAAHALALEGNPVHEDMIDALQTLKDKKIFSIQTVLDKHRSIYAVTAGDIFLSMDAAIKYANEVFSVRIPRKEDIVVSVAPYPMDVDLYQAQKALDNGKLALNDKGILILVAKCRTGIGPETFYNLMASCDTREEVMEKIRNEFKLGYHKAAKMVEIGLWADIWAVSDLPKEKMEKIFITAFPDIQSALDAALARKGADSKVLFLMEGSITVPMISA